MTINRPPRNLKRLFLFNGILFLIVAMLIQYAVVQNTDQPVAVENYPIQPVLQGKFGEKISVFDTPTTLQNFNFRTVFDKEISLEDLKGQWVVLNFWATWCPPCLVEMPALQALRDSARGQGFQVIAISLDRNMDGKKLRDFINARQFGPVAAYYGDWTKIRDVVDVKALPTTYILSPNGQAIAAYYGDAEWAGEDAKAFIASLLNPERP